MKCIYCGKEADSSFELCPHCGRPIHDEIKENATDLSEDKSDMVITDEGKTASNSGSDNENVSFYAFVENVIASKYRISLYVLTSLLFFDLLYVVSRSENVFIALTGIAVSALLSFGMLYANNIIISAVVILYQTFLFSVIKASVGIFAIVISYAISLTVTVFLRMLKRGYEKYLSSSSCALIANAPTDSRKRKYAPHVKRTASICGIVIVASITSIFVSFSVYKVTKYSEIDSGQWTDGVYTNDFAEFSFFLPDGWSHYDDSELHDYYEYINGTQPDDISNGGMLMYAHDGNYHSAVAVELIDMKRWYRAETIIFSWIKDYEDNADGGYSYSHDEVKSLEIGGNDYCSVGGTYKSTDDGNVSSREIVAVRTYGKYCISITIITRDDADPAALLEYFGMRTVSGD